MLLGGVLIRDDVATKMVPYRRFWSWVNTERGKFHLLDLRP